MNPWKISTVTLALALGAVLAFGSGQPVSADKEPQPLMRAALHNLNQAKENLEKATHDKGGHRVKALELTKEAIEEVKKGIAADNRN